MGILFEIYIVGVVITFWNYVINYDDYGVYEKYPNMDREIYEHIRGNEKTKLLFKAAKWPVPLLKKIYTFLQNTSKK